MNKVTITSQESQAHVASVDLRNRTGEWKRRQTLCDNRDCRENNFKLILFEITFLQTSLFFKQILL